MREDTTKRELEWFRNLRAALMGQGFPAEMAEDAARARVEQAKATLRAYSSDVLGKYRDVEANEAAAAALVSTDPKNLRMVIAHVTFP